MATALLVHELAGAGTGIIFAKRNHMIAKWKWMFQSMLVLKRHAAYAKSQGIRQTPASEETP